MRRGCLVFLGCGVVALGAGTATSAAALTQPQLEQLAAEAHARIAARIVVPFTQTIEIQITKEKPPPGESDAIAYVDQALAKGGNCVVRWTALGLKEKLPEARTEMLHELTHCLELQLNKGQSPVPDWVSE